MDSELDLSVPLEDRHYQQPSYEQTIRLVEQIQQHLENMRKIIKEMKNEV